MNHFIYISLILFAFTLPLSIAVSEGILVIGLIGWIVKMILDKKLHWQKTPLDLPVLVFVVVAFLSSFWGVDVKNSLIGFRTYGLILIIYLILNNTTSDKIRTLVRTLICGASILSTFTIVDRLLKITRGSDPVLAGSMSEAGQLLIIIGIVTAILLYREERKIRVLLSIALMLMIAAEILNFKRGPWISLMFVLGIQGWIKSRKMLLAAILTAAVILALFQPARDRLMNLKDEFSPTRGGRLAMWEITPSILRDHPIGVGIDNVGSVMYKYNSAIESGRTHLHSTPPQILVEMGPVGLIAFLWWMVAFIKLSLRTFHRIEPKNSYEKALMLGIFSAFIGFLINGLVEFNFGDSEVVMVVYTMMGLTLLLNRKLGE
jgi:hypothetical protein